MKHTVTGSKKTTGSVTIQECMDKFEKEQKVTVIAAGQVIGFVPGEEQ